ncbi:MAG: glycine zipper 2TM domain-containing protein [Betaproteobacteria bacterium]|nr:glycine zipper 2TM domain-containing protein [Betaproteobacteria bacterium]
MTMRHDKAGIGVGLLIALALGARPAAANDYVAYARVLDVTPQYQRVNNPRVECRTEYAPATPSPAPRAIGGSILGGIAGAILGNQVGQGNGRTAATVAGTITGAIVGDRLQNRQPDAGYGSEPVRRCEQVDHWDRQWVGYRVHYAYAGRTFVTTMPNAPGDRMPVQVSVNPY